MLQGDAGGPLVSCGRDGNCGTTPGMNYEVIGDLSIIKSIMQWVKKGLAR